MNLFRVFRFGNRVAARLVDSELAVDKGLDEAVRANSCSTTGTHLSANGEEDKQNQSSELFYKGQLLEKTIASSPVLERCEL